MKDLTDTISSPLSEPYEIAEAEMELPLLKEKFAKAQSSLSAKEQALGVDGQREYRHLASSPFITDHMNAHALKIRLRQHLQARKFERSFRWQMNTLQRKLHRHTEDTVKQRDGGIQSLARNYNKLCERMSDQIAKKKAPAHAVAPRPIPMKELFSLDVRVGIQGILLRDRCDEEMLRLKHEVLVMEEWFSEEWKVVLSAIDSTQVPTVAAACKSYMAGPGPDELREVEHEIQAELVDQICESEEVDEDSELDEDDLDIGLIEHIDALTVNDIDINIQDEI
ncbi:hypothetical protein EV361DRAFT_979126 [Lentinula raphanica]|nr:hypothetical protein EV361DRAFT_979126 [Lentinula raphanica]